MISCSGASTVLILSPVQWRTAAMVSTSNGSAIASVMVWSSRLMGRQRNWRRKRGERASVSAETKGRGVDGDQRHIQLLRERRQNVAHGDEAHVDQRFADLIAALFLQFERPFQVFLR